LCRCKTVQQAAQRRADLLPTSAAAAVFGVSVGRFTRAMDKLGVHHDDERTNPRQPSGPKARLWSKQKLLDLKRAIASLSSGTDAPPDDGDTVDCDACAKPFALLADVCPHCGHDHSAEADPS